MPMFKVTFRCGRRRREFSREVSVKTPTESALLAEAKRVWRRHLASTGAEVVSVRVTALEDVLSHGFVAGSFRDLTFE